MNASELYFKLGKGLMTGEITPTASVDMSVSIDEGETRESELETVTFHKSLVSLRSWQA